MTGLATPSAPALERDGWEKRTQVMWLAPAPPLAAPEDTPNIVMQPAPRSNLLLLTTAAAQDATAAAELGKFLATTEVQVPGLTVVERSYATPFADGVEGAEVVLEFSPTTDVRLRQTHLFRIDAEVLTQLVVTVEASGAEHEEELRDAALSLWPARGGAG